MSQSIDGRTPVPAPPPKSGGDAIAWIYLQGVIAFVVLWYSISRLAVVPEIVQSGAIWTGARSDQRVDVVARVKNRGGTGAVTLYANLQTDKGKWEQRETVVIPQSREVEFRFVFREWTGASPTFSTTLAENHSVQSIFHVSVPRSDGLPPSR